jgi:abortive infection bacteriophage resistance protein
MIIPNILEAERTLRFISYFRLKGYWLPFVNHAGPGTARTLRPGTTFDDVLRLYDFDRKLRLLVLDEIERLEVAIRTVICNELSVSHGPHWYLSKHQEVMYRSTKDFDAYDFLNGVHKETTRSSDLLIKHYYATYDNPMLPPSWAAAETISFGKWSRLYAGLKIGQSAIAAQFNLPAPVFGSWLHSLTVLRNICAHHGRVYNRRFHFTPIVLQTHASYMTDQKALFTLAVIIRLMTKVIDPLSDFPRRLATLCNSVPGVPQAAMGFPQNWQSDTFWT